MQQTKWFERKFNFTSTQNIFPSIVERLWGTPVRLEEKLKSIPPEILTTKVNGSWTIKENIGHLTDLEPLWQVRLEELKAGKQELSAAELQNTKTHNANHNEVHADKLLNDFRNIRQETLLMLEGIDDELVFRSALHPRLKTPMRTMDLFLFVAEHDDHHLARISELVKILQK
ncbi:MAG: DinB family protein [Ignavibacteriales bacterium]|nr:MAG: DinB family protein [Ignavibacteriales bacterium]